MWKTQVLKKLKNLNINTNTNTNTKINSNSNKTNKKLKYQQTQNSNCFKTQKHKLWQNFKTQIVKKLQN